MFALNLRSVGSDCLVFAVKHLHRHPEHSPARFFDGRGVVLDADLRDIIKELERRGYGEVLARLWQESSNGSVEV